MLVKPDDPILTTRIKRGPIPADLPARLLEACRRFGGLGLAAPQIGEPYHCFVLADGRCFANSGPYTPLDASWWTTSWEGCLSLPGFQYQVRRYTDIVMDDRIYGGQDAIVIQHERDHLDGVLISKRALQCRSLVKTSGFSASIRTSEPS